MSFTPTPEQLAIIEAAQSTKDNLAVMALAGAAKTSSLVLIAEALPSTSILSLAFNKKIAVEMSERLPSNCVAMTLNSLGHRVWSDSIGRRLKIEPSKVYNIIKEVIDDQPKEDRPAAYEFMAEAIKLVSFGKQCGYIPTDTYPKGKRLMDDDEFRAHLERDLEDWEFDLVRGATLISLEQAMLGLCDFDDQILMPTLFHGVFPRYPLVLIDEAQDLSALNHATLRKLVRKRVIAVGDPNQAIYGFRGAHENSMDLLIQTFSMRTLPLSISFRCPSEVVKHVQWKTPQMRWPDWAKAGTVRTFTKWSVADMPDDAAVICRNNAPLFALAIKLLKNGRHCEIAGKDMLAGLTKIMRKFGGSDLSQATVFDRIAQWEDKELSKAKARAEANIRDRAECMRIFARQGQNLGDALAYAQHLSAMFSPLKLMTGHKSKGLEFNTVFFLDQKLVSKHEQDPNLRYVICTRAKEELIYVNSEDFVETHEMGMASQSN